LTREENLDMIHHREIIVGSSLPALIHAFNKNIPVFYSDYDRPFELDFLDPNLDLKFLGIDNISKTLKGMESEITVGIKKTILWERLLFLLSLEGKAPLSGLCNVIRYNGNTLVFTDEYSKIGEITFDKCYYYGDNNCRNLVRTQKEPTKYLCRDWIAFNCGGKHQYDYIETNDDFVNKILFYISTRRRGNYNIKDACSISLLTEDQINDFDYSETMARFKTVHEMKSRGMRSRVANRDSNGKPLSYRSFKTSYMNREIKPMDATYISSDSKIIVVDEYIKEDQISKQNKFVETVGRLF
jgi:hypothetical protein|tara:strand:- start:4989 stop:5885 length:897 start_codon:yes stop_codon:yes gene_type:complete